MTRHTLLLGLLVASAAITVVPARAAVGQGATRVMLVDLYAGEQATMGCGDRVLAIPYAVPEGADPLRVAVEALLRPDNGPARRAGLYNALAPSQLTIESLEVRRGTATLLLVGELRTIDGCDRERISGQLNATLLQYREIVNVDIRVNGVPLQEALARRP